MASDKNRNATAGLSLYANLLQTESKGGQGTISSAPVVYSNAQAPQNLQEQSLAGKSQLSSAAFRPQPTRRPQIPSQKAKPKLGTQRPANNPSSAHVSSNGKDEGAEGEISGARAPSKTLADWAADGEEDGLHGYYTGEKRQRGGRKKKKRNKDEVEVLQNWDDIYDPSRPNVFDEYKNSDERILEIQEWKERLHAHKKVQDPALDSDSEGDMTRPVFHQRFAPPPQLYNPSSSEYKEAPIPETDSPPSLPSPSISSAPGLHFGEAHQLDQFRASELTPCDPPVSANLTSMTRVNAPPPPPGPSSPPPPPAPPTSFQRSLVDTLDAVPPPPSPPPSRVRTSASATNIQREPVRYNLPPPPSELPATVAELDHMLHSEEHNSFARASDPVDERSARPGQKGFAERLMSKYGWTKGSGLGAGGSGITAPLRVQLEKQKKKPDSEGGGYATPAGMGKIIGGGRKAAAAGQESKFGPMSNIIVLKGMLDGMNIDEEMETGEGGIIQEIGEECGEKYGRVERVFIDRSDSAAAVVFVKFTAELSALRAVNALEGRVFNGNTITAKFGGSTKVEL